MAKKELPKIEEVLNTLISWYSFDDRVKLHELLTENIKGEALIMKEKGENAVKVLNKIEANGK